MSRVAVVACLAVAAATSIGAQAQQQQQAPPPPAQLSALSKANLAKPRPSHRSI